MLAKLVYGLSVAFVGVATVFVGLVILIGLIKVPEIAMGLMTKKQPKTETAPAVPDVVEETAPQTDDGELVAVIAAAVAAVLASEGAQTTDGFVVRSIRRVSNAPAWNRAGREEQIYSRM